MSGFPAELRYAPSHEWVRVEDDGIVTVGISDHAQALLGDLVFVETPQVDSQVSAGGACAVVESVKAASDVYAPVSGEILEVNSLLMDSPELINSDPYGQGWIFKIKASDPDEVENLLDAEGYEASIEENDD